MSRGRVSGLVSGSRRVVWTLVGLLLLLGVLCVSGSTSTSTSCGEGNAGANLVDDGRLLLAAVGRGSSRRGAYHRLLQTPEASGDEETERPSSQSPPPPVAPSSETTDEIMVSTNVQLCKTSFKTYFFPFANGNRQVTDPVTNLKSTGLPWPEKYLTKYL